jgi:pSer/pThr/pTyr-binding forkhead associated (FHA) protein
VLQEFVVAVTLPGTPESFTRTCSATVTVGRSPDADIQLVHPLVSRYHAELSVQDGRLVIRDLGSRNGTVVNDELVRSDVRFAAGEATLQIGPYVLRVAEAGVLAAETLATSAPSTTGRAVLDRDLRRLLVDGRPALEALTGLEYRLLDVLASNGRSVVPNQQLGDTLWGEGGWDIYMLHNLVHRVRRKLEAKGFPADELIVSIPRSGYRLA